MKLCNTLNLLVLNSLATSILATPLPSPAPAIILPPKSFQVKIVTSPSENCQTLGFLTLPPPPLEGSLPHVTSAPSTLFFNQKNIAGLGWISNGPVFYAVDWYILSWTGNSTISHSAIYLDNTVNSATDGYVPLIVQATHLFNDGNLYFKGIVTGLGGGSVTTNPATFSWDKTSRELFVNTHPWPKQQTVYLQIVPL